MDSPSTSSSVASPSTLSPLKREGSLSLERNGDIASASKRLRNVLMGDDGDALEQAQDGDGKGKGKEAEELLAAKLEGQVTCG